MLQKKLANSFARKKKYSFWFDVRRLKSSSHLVSPIVDGVTGSRNVANVFTSQLQSILNSHSSSSHSSLHSSLQSSVTPSDISSIEFHENDVLEALSHLKTGKSGGDGASAEHLIFATSALISPLAVYFTSLVRDGFMRSCFQDYNLIPVPKKNQDVTSSSSYHPICSGFKNS